LGEFPSFLFTLEKLCGGRMSIFIAVKCSAILEGEKTKHNILFVQRIPKKISEESDNTPRGREGATAEGGEAVELQVADHFCL